MKILMEVFNRGGFTGGYYKEYHGKDMMSMKRPDHQGLFVGKISKLMKGKISFTAREDIHKGDVLQIRISPEEKVELTSPSDFRSGSKVVLNGQKMKKLHEGMEIKRTLNHPMIERIDEGLKQKKKENLKGKIIIKKDQCAKLILKAGDDFVEVSGPVIEEAQKNGATMQDVEKLLKKTGQTHYQFETLEVELGENLFVPGSVLKKLRKEAFAQMDQAKILKYRRIYEEPKRETENLDSQEEGGRKTAVSLESFEHLDIICKNESVDKIYLSWIELKGQPDPSAVTAKVKAAGKQCYIMLPQIARKRQMRELEQKKTILFSEDIDGLVIRNLEVLSWLIDEGCQKELPALNAIIDEMGMHIVADDVAAQSRQYRTDVPAGDDALQALADKFAAMDNCSVLYNQDKPRVKWIVDTAKERGAKGVLVVLTKFCDPEEFDYVMIKKACEAAGIPLTLVEVDRQMVQFEQVRTNLETFRDLLMM